MKIYCLDKNPAARAELINAIEGTFEDSRKSIDVTESFEFIPCTIEQIAISESARIIIFGPEIDVDDVIKYCRYIKNIRNNAVIYVFLKEKNYTLRIMKRFQDLAEELFSSNEIGASFVLKLINQIGNLKQEAKGKVITFEGVKGGVGASTVITSVASSLATKKKKVLVIDLSQSGFIYSALLIDKKVSPEFNVFLSDESKIKNSDLIIETDYGFDVMLSPGFSPDLRDKWIRDYKKFELTLDLIRNLQAEYDYVLIDLARVEGILPYSLRVRAEQNFYISNNNPESIFMLLQLLREENSSITPVKSKIIFNSTNKTGFKIDDYKLYLKIDNQEIENDLYELGMDSLVSEWIGSGYTPYTAAKGSYKSKINILAASIISKASYRFLDDQPEKFKLIDYIKSFFRKEESTLEDEELVVEGTAADNLSKNIEVVKLEADRVKNKDLHAIKRKNIDYLSHSIQRGNLSLETALWISGSITLAALITSYFVPYFDLIKRSLTE